MRHKKEKELVENKVIIYSGKIDRKQCESRFVMEDFGWKIGAKIGMVGIFRNSKLELLTLNFLTIWFNSFLLTTGGLVN